MNMTFPFIKTLESEFVAACHDSTFQAAPDATNVKEAKHFHLLALNRIKTISRMAQSEPCILSAMNAISTHHVLFTPKMQTPTTIQQNQHARLLELYSSLAKELIHSFIMYGLAVVRLVPDNELIVRPMVTDLSECEVAVQINSFGERDYRVYMWSKFCPDATVMEHRPVTVKGQILSQLTVLLDNWFALRRCRYFREVTDPIYFTPYVVVHRDNVAPTPSPQAVNSSTPCMIDGVERREAETTVPLSFVGVEHHMVVNVKPGYRATLTPVASSHQELREKEKGFVEQVKNTLQVHTKIEDRGGNKKVSRSDIPGTGERSPLDQSAIYWGQIVSRHIDSLLRTIYGSCTLKPLQQRDSFVLQYMLSSHYDLTYFKNTRLRSLDDRLFQITVDLCSRQMRRLALSLNLENVCDVFFSQCDPEVLCHTGSYPSTVEMEWQSHKHHQSAKEQAMSMATFYCQGIFPETKIGHANDILSLTDRRLLESLSVLLRSFVRWREKEKQIRMDAFIRFMYLHLWTTLYTVSDLDLQNLAILFFRQEPSETSDASRKGIDNKFVHFYYPTLRALTMERMACIYDIENRVQEKVTKIMPTPLGSSKKRLRSQTISTLGVAPALKDSKPEGNNVRPGNDTIQTSPMDRQDSRQEQQISLSDGGLESNGPFSDHVDKVLETDTLDIDGKDNSLTPISNIVV